MTTRTLLCQAAATVRALRKAGQRQAARDAAWTARMAIGAAMLRRCVA